MKGFNFLLLLLLFSCEKKENPVLEKDTGDYEVNRTAPTKPVDSLMLNDWFQYYHKENPDFSPEKFVLQQTSPISYTETSVIILNQKGFNEIYKPFLIFNESKDHYLDLDSYQWFLGPDGSASFEADQQIVLVDYKNKEADQIAFFGPSYWIEDAYWKGDSVAVLLGNSYEKVPFKMEYNFKKGRVKNYKYPDTLKFEKPYSKFKLEKKGIKIN